MRIVSWNVNGIRAVMKKGALAELMSSQPDVVLLQEVRASDEIFEGLNDLQSLIFFGSYHCYLGAGEKAGYSGVAILSKREADEVRRLGDEEFDQEGRALMVRFGDTWVASCYFPNSQEEGKRLDYKVRFFDSLLAEVQKIEKAGQHVIVGGDYNVAHRAIDLARPKENVGKPGFIPEECQAMDLFLERFVDVYREANPEKTGAYTWWSYRGGARSRNVGWRIDYLCCTRGIVERVHNPKILADQMGSDHCPVSIEFDLI